jgi:hypothetical protein
MDLRFSQAVRKSMEAAIVGVVWKCFCVEVEEGARGLQEGKRRDEVRQGVRVVKAVYSCGVRLVNAFLNADVEAMM